MRKAPLTVEGVPQRIIRVQGTEKLTIEELNLSPDRVKEGANLTTEVLHKILERKDQSRHFGINE